MAHLKGIIYYNKMAKFCWICKTMQNQSVEMLWPPVPANRYIYIGWVGRHISFVLEATNH